MNDDLRVLPLPIAEWDPSLKNIVDDMHGSPINVHRLMANHPALLQAWWNFRNYSVDGGDLGRRKGELVILRVATRVRAWYEWGAHVERALKVGISREEIERVKQGGEAPGWEVSEAMLLRAVDELFEDYGLSERTHARLREHYTARQVMDLMAIQGAYVILAAMINTWDLELDATTQEKLPADITREQFEREYPRTPRKG
ncbi:carboxymuconolactone decarboxylase family protein [Gordonia rhizosphera NBRC 16068]|uniref:carboxymuconolactone decarboxylase family protein n=1 Tax=Gordonia rhizosphera TaxID=83341 RepID=UPI003EDEDD49